MNMNSLYSNVRPPKVFIGFNLQSSIFNLQSVIFLVALLGSISRAWAVFPDRRPEPKFTAHRRIEKIMTLDRNDTVVLANQFGNVVISAWASSQIKVNAELVAGADTKVSAESCLGCMAVNATQQGRRITVCSARDKGDCSATQFQTDLTIVVPDAVVLTVENSYGDITITGVQGVVTATNRFGTTNVHGVRYADVTNAFGDVNLERVQGFVVRNRVGNVTAHDVTGPIRITNETGAIRLIRTVGPAQLENKFGEVVATDCQGRIEIANSQGPVTFRQLRVSSDTVRITGRRSALHLKLPATASARVNARVVQGSIVCAQPPLNQPAGSSGFDQALSYQFGDGTALFDLESIGAGITIDMERGK